MSALVSVLIPARNEERVLPRTLPTVLHAARRMGVHVEVVVCAPVWSSVHSDPPVRDPLVRWAAVTEPGKYEALRCGAAQAQGDTLVLVDADVLVDPDAFSQLVRPIQAGGADVVAGHIEVLHQSATPAQRVLERWATVSTAVWDTFRRERPEFLWALPGAIYAIRRQFLPLHSLLVPLVDDASIGLWAKEEGAVFAYAPRAVVRTAAPRTAVHWTRQKLRSRRGWAELARLRREEVVPFERAFRTHLGAALAADPRSWWLMRAQDQLLRWAARTSTVVWPATSGAWTPDRPGAPVPELGETKEYQ